jgi:hypothetical protein
VDFQLNFLSFTLENSKISLYSKLTNLTVTYGSRLVPGISCENKNKKGLENWKPHFYGLQYEFLCYGPRLAYSLPWPSNDNGFLINVAQIDEKKNDIAILHMNSW